MCFLRAWMTHSVVGPLSVCHLHNPILRRSDAGHGWLSGLVPFSTREMLRNILSCTDCPTYIRGTYPSSPRALTMPLRIMPEDLHPRTPSCSPSISLVTLTYSLALWRPSPVHGTDARVASSPCSPSTMAAEPFRQPQFISQNGASTTPTAHQTRYSHAVASVAHGPRREPRSTAVNARGDAEDIATFPAGRYTP